MLSHEIFHKPKSSGTIQIVDVGFHRGGVVCIQVNLATGIFKRLGFCLEGPDEDTILLMIIHFTIPGANAWFDLLRCR